MLGLMNHMFECLYQTYCTKIYSKATVYVSELLLMQFSPFDIKFKILNHLSTNTTKWSNTLKQFASWYLNGSCEKILEMISYCIISKTTILIVWLLTLKVILHKGRSKFL